MTYRGRIAPTPTGYLHLGHYRTFRTAWQRARDAGGKLVFRQEDIDPRAALGVAAGLLVDLDTRFVVDVDGGAADRRHARS